MFEAFSRRARGVLVAARFKAGQRGADAIGVDDLLLGLIVEDQGILFREVHPEVESSEVESPQESHSPFFPSDIASVLLMKIGELLPRSDPVPSSREMGVSTDLKSLLVEARELQRELRHNEVEPLHLLAAVLRKSSHAVDLLRQAGIYREKVMNTLRKEPPAL